MLRLHCGDRPLLSEFYGSCHHSWSAFWADGMRAEYESSLIWICIGEAFIALVADNIVTWVASEIDDGVPISSKDLLNKLIHVAHIVSISQVSSTTKEAG